MTSSVKCNTDLQGANLVDLRQTGAGQDGVRVGSKLIAKIGYLANGMGGGDFKPTNQHIEVQQWLGRYRL